MHDASLSATGVGRSRPSAGALADFALAPCSPAVLAGLLGLCALACLGLVLMPSYLIGAQLNDFFLYVDWMHRWASGQVPHRDYHAPLGFLATLPAALGYLATGDFGRGMRTGDVLVFAAVAGPLALAAWTRLSNGLSTIAVLVTAALLLTPLDLFNLLAEPSAAMAYNRAGWGAMLVGTLFLAPSRRPASKALDLAALAVLAFAMLYLKATYGLALGVLGLLYLAIHRPAPRDLVPALLIVLAGIALVEATLGITRAYVADLAFAASVDGGGRLKPGPVSRALVTSATDVVFGALVPVAMLLAYGRGWIAAAVVLLLALAVAIMLQNAQARDLPVLIGTAIVAVAWIDGPRLARAARLFALLVPLAAAAPLLEHVLLTWDATTRLLWKPGALAGTPLPGLASLRVRAEPGLDLLERALDDRASARDYVAGTFRLPPTGVQVYRLADELAALAAARDLVPACRLAGGSILLADFANPLPAVAGLPPAGRMPVLHMDRSFSESRHPPAEDVLKGVDCVMVPALPMESTASDLAMKLYGEAIRSRFPVVERTRFFTIHRRG